MSSDASVISQCQLCRAKLNLTGVGDLAINRGVLDESFIVLDDKRGGNDRHSALAFMLIA